MIIVFAVLLLDQTFNNTVNTISRSDGIILFIIFSIFLIYIYNFNKTNHSIKELIFKEKAEWSLPKSIIISTIGLAGIALGSDLAVDNCINIANTLNISQKLITMVILVIGTSSPELVMGITSAKKGEFDIILGNIIGTNLFNIGFVLGLPVIVFGNVISYNFNIIDMFLMIVSGIVLYIFAKDDKKIDKLEGIVMISIFLIYYVYLFLT